MSKTLYKGRSICWSMLNTRSRKREAVRSPAVLMCNSGKFHHAQCQQFMLSVNNASNLSMASRVFPNKSVEVALCILLLCGFQTCFQAKTKSVWPRAKTKSVWPRSIVKSVWPRSIVRRKSGIRNRREQHELLVHTDTQWINPTI